MAVTRKRKAAQLKEYGELVKKSQAIFLTSYKGVTVKNIQALRAKVREASGEYHVLKNTLAAIALKEAGLPVPEDLLSTSTAMGFALNDAAAVAKAIADFAKDSEFVKMKGGVMGGKLLSAKQVEALAALPPLPVVRAQLLGLMKAPATRLTGVIAGGVRQVVNVVKAYSEKEAPAPA